LWLAGLLLWATGVSRAHYPFVRYSGEAASYEAVPAKFDLDAFPDGSVPYFVVRPLPVLASGETQEMLLAQIRQAAGVWSGVRTSRMRLRFGGFVDAGSSQWPLGIYIQFAELEGVLARGGPVTLDTVIRRGNEAFLPIQTSLIEIPSNLQQWSVNSDEFFLTLVHEFGHALGLQHTFTSSAMSTAATRTTTRAQPLGGDDVAGLSVLYPAPAFETRTAKIRGRVTSGAQGVHLASVVAIPSSGDAVSTLTGPDGAYEIAGLPPGLYYLYVHSLPPAVNQVLGPGDVVLPVDPGGKPVPAGPPIQGTFYPGAGTVAEARYVHVEAGQAVEVQDLEVRPRDSYKNFGVATYGCPGEYCLQPAYVARPGTRNYFLAWGPELTIDGAMAPGLSVETVGGASVILPEKTKVYQPFGPEGASFLQLYLWHHLLSVPGARHLVFRFPEEVYVLPAGVHVVDSQPPSISSVQASVDNQGHLRAIVRGSNLTPATRILFSGVPGLESRFDWESGALNVLVPPGPAGLKAVVVALDPNGQTSMFLDAKAPVLFEYPQTPQYEARLATAAAAPAGAETMVEIRATGPEFQEGWVELIPDSPKVLVRQVWVVAPDRLLANIAVSAQAGSGDVKFQLLSGLRTIPVTGSLQIAPAQQNGLSVDPALVNPATGRRSVYAGGEALVKVKNLPGVAPGEAAVRVGGEPAAVLAAEAGQLRVQLPPNLPVGPAVLELSARGQQAPPVVVAIDPPPPVIRAVARMSGYVPSERVVVAQGELIALWVEGLGDVSAEEVDILAGGVAETPVQVASLDDERGHVLWVHIGSNVPVGADVELRVAVGERVSAPYAITVRAMGE
jgi:uncharacterized protein (TIGR03437 family)